MKLPPQVASVSRHCGNGDQSAQASVIPHVAKDLIGWPDKTGRVHYFHCPDRFHWSPCNIPDNFYYECCPTGKDCKQDPSGATTNWGCFA
jgi:hypothetical protein